MSQIILGLLLVVVFGYILYVINTQTNYFKNNKSREGFENSDDKFYKQIIDAYNHVFDRNPTQTELFTQFERIKEGKSIEDITLELFSGETLPDASSMPNDVSGSASTIDNSMDLLIPSSSDSLNLIDTTTTVSATQAPTKAPVKVATQAPTQAPVQLATQAPTQAPTRAPTQGPTQTPSPTPAKASIQPSSSSQLSPTQAPTKPTSTPTHTPTKPSTSTTTTTSNGTTVVFDRPTIYNYYGVDKPSENGNSNTTSSNSKTGTVILPGQVSSALDVSSSSNAISKQANANSTGYMIADPVGNPTSIKVLNKDEAAKQLDLKDKDFQGAYNQNRNMNELQYGCQRNTKYSNATDDMKLFPEYEWSVPQQIPPVCLHSENNYKSPVEQTSLLGTLLQDANKTNVGSIMPLYPSPGPY